MDRRGLSDEEILKLLEEEYNDNMSEFSDAPSNNSDHDTESEEHHTNTDSDLFGDDTDIDPNYDPFEDQYQSEDEQLDGGNVQVFVGAGDSAQVGEVAEDNIQSAERAEGDVWVRGRGRGRGCDGSNVRVGVGAGDNVEVDEGAAIDFTVGGESANYYYGKNKFKWSETPLAPSRTRATNIVITFPGLIGSARVNKPQKPVDAWRLLIDETMIDTTVEHTNEKITEVVVKYGQNVLYCQFTEHMDRVEIEALIGLLYLAGVFKSNHEDIYSLFSTDGTGRDIFRSVISLKRFLFLLTALRFDNAQTRDVRMENDRLAPISDLLNAFIANCQSNYSCGEYTTVDEMLVPFRGRCKFRMYMKSKPARYGLKVMCICDSRTHYLFNAFVYTGKNCIQNP